MIVDLARIIKRLNNPEYLRCRSLETYRVLTSSFRLLPDFLIIGVQKGGTTSLYRYLEQHPCVAPAFAKEVHFFDNHTRDCKYSKGMRWYRSNFVYQTNRTLHQIRHKQNLLTGEGSPDYIFDPLAPKRIAQTLPHIKIIILLRNPVDRAYSHYLHNIRAAWDPHREPLSFEEAIEAEAERIQGEREKLLAQENYFSYNYMHYSYLARGLYIEQLKTWFSLFPPEQFLILNSEDFFHDPDVVYQQVLKFLGLAPFQLPAYQSFNARAKNNSGMSAALREKLALYYAASNQQLYQFLQRDFHWNE